eukprot:7900163-Pyramimonas_sp.AAC.1
MEKAAEVPKPPAQVLGCSGSSHLQQRRWAQTPMGQQMRSAATNIQKTGADTMPDTRKTA